MTASAAAAPARPARVYSEKQRGRLGLWLFLGSEAFLFTAFISARFYYLFSPEPVTRPDNLNQFLGLMLALLLLVSSLTAYRAETLWHYGEKKSSQVHIIVTIILGVIFLAGVAMEWAEGFENIPLDGPNARFATLFYSMTGLHAFHVLSGIIALGFTARMAAKGSLDAPDNWAVEGVVKYWHLVDVVWVFIYPALYLIN